MIGEFLYQLSPRDMQQSWLDPVIVTVNGLTTASVVTASYEVPMARCLLLRSSVANADGGGAQTVDRVTLELLPPDESNIAVAISEKITTNVGSGSNKLSMNTEWNGEIVIPQEWTLRARGNFSAAVSANSIELHIVGLLIPIGNIQRI